ncbi:CoA transferase [Bordetella bronchiseptica]|nr:CoA transferase [Bordetella bronchiseptica]
MKLTGIKILDLSQILPGPYATQAMADHGAQVVRIEPPGGDISRNLGPRQSGESVWFANTHRGKESVVLDLKCPGGVSAFMRLAQEADVIVESYRPGVADRLGIGPVPVRRANPRIVYCSISAYGQTGPKALRPAHDLSVQAESGLLGLNLGADGEPVAPAIVAADMAASLTALSAILMALVRRAATGEGDYIDIAMYDSLLAFHPHLMGTVFSEGREPDRQRQRWYGGAAFYAIYRCADSRYLTLGGSEMKFVRNLLGALGRPDLVAFCERPPGPDQDPVREFLAACFAARPLSYWESFLARLDVCWAPVRGLCEAMQDEQVQARQMRVDAANGLSFLGTPFKFQDEPGKVCTDVPALGREAAGIAGAAGMAHPAGEYAGEREDSTGP